MIVDSLSFHLYVKYILKMFAICNWVEGLLDLLFVEYNLLLYVFESVFSIL